MRKKKHNSILKKSNFQGIKLLCYLLLSILAAAQDVNLTTPNEAMKTITVLAVGFAAEKKCELRKERGVPL